MRQYSLIESQKLGAEARVAGYYNARNILRIDKPEILPPFTFENENALPFAFNHSAPPLNTPLILSLRIFTLAALTAHRKNLFQAFPVVVPTGVCNTRRGLL